MLGYFLALVSIYAYHLNFVRFRRMDGLRRIVLLLQCLGQRSHCPFVLEAIKGGFSCTVFELV